MSYNIYLSKFELCCSICSIDNLFYVSIPLMVRVRDSLSGMRHLALSPGTCSAPHAYSCYDDRNTITCLCCDYWVNEFIFVFPTDFCGISVDRRYDYYVIPLDFEWQYCDLICGYPGALIQPYYANIDVAIMKPYWVKSLNVFSCERNCEKPLITTQIGELRATASQVVPEDNVCCGTITDQFSKTLCQDMDLFEMQNTNYANLARCKVEIGICLPFVGCICTCNYSPISGYRNCGTFTTQYQRQEWLIKDAYNIYGQGRSYICVDIVSDNAINVNDIIVDENINQAGGDTCYYINGRSYSVETDTYRLRLNEYEQQTVNLCC
jgi:hypothetical protein